MDLIKYKQIKNGALPKFQLGKLGNFIQPQNILPTSLELDNLDLKLYKNGLKNQFGHISPNIQNTTTGTKPSVSTTENIVNAGAGALGLISQNMAAARPAATTEDLVNNANKVTNSIDGFSFTTYGDGGEGKAMSDTSANATANTLGSMASGAAAGASFGPWGAAVGGAVGLIGGLFSGSSARRKQMEAIQRAQKIKANKNESAFDNAYTSALQKKQAEEYGNVEGQQLFQAAYGKRPVWSPNGLVGRKATARVSNGEIIGSLEDGIVTRVPGEKNNKDTKLAALSDGDFVLSNKYGISDYAAATGDYLGALNLQEMLLGKMRNIHGYKNGKLPGFNIGGILPSLFNAGVGLDQIVRSKNQLSSPSSYVAPLTNLQDLHEISMSMLPIYANNRNIEARTRNAIVRSGGLGAGQIASALAANTLNTQLANSQALQQGQIQNNQYKANAITANYQADAQEAARKTAAGQWDYDKYASAHNAAEQQRQMGLYNIANAWREGYKNMWDKEQFDRMYNLYFQDMKNKEMYYNSLMNKPTAETPQTTALKQSNLDNEMFGDRLTRHFAATQPISTYLTDQERISKAVQNAPDFVNLWTKKVSPVLRRRSIKRRRK